MWQIMECIYRVSYFGRPWRCFSMFYQERWKIACPVQNPKALSISILNLVSGMYTQALGGPGVWKRRAESTLTGHSTNYKNLRLYEEAIFLRLCCVIISHLRFICPVTSLFSSFGLDFISLLRDNNRDYSSLCILQIIKQSCNFFQKDSFLFFIIFSPWSFQSVPRSQPGEKKAS